MLLYKTTRFHVAVRLFSNRSQKTSKCGKNISDALGYASCATFFDVICDLLLNRRTVTWNLVVKEKFRHVTFWQTSARLTGTNWPNPVLSFAQQTDRQTHPPSQQEEESE